MHAQAIGDAYQVLSDAERRRKYDEKGLAGLSDDRLADPGVVFAMMFGEEQFGHLIGDLAVVTAHRVQEEGLGQKEAAARLKEKQKEREARLAKLLALRLDGWVSGEREAFVKEALAEVAKLSQLHMGAPMLLSIGIEYELSADRALGVKGNDWFGNRADAHLRQTASKAAMVSAPSPSPRRAAPLCPPPPPHCPSPPTPPQRVAHPPLATQPPRARSSARVRPCAPAMHALRAHRRRS